MVILCSTLITFSSSSSSDSEDEPSRKDVMEEEDDDEQETSQTMNNKKGLIVVRDYDEINNKSSNSSRYSGSQKRYDTAMIEVRIDDQPNTTLPSSSHIGISTNTNENGDHSSQGDTSKSQEKKTESVPVCRGLPGGALSNMLDCCCGKEGDDKERVNDDDQNWGVHPERDESDDMDST